MNREYHKIPVGQPTDAAPDAWVRRSLLVRHWQAVKEEISTHKWYESERAGHDIGWERAAVRYRIFQGMNPPSS